MSSAKGSKASKSAKTSVSASPGGSGKLPKLFAKPHLEAEKLYEDTIYSIADVLSEKEVADLLEFLQKQHPLENVCHPQTKAFAWRNVDRVEFRSPELSSALWSAGLSAAVTGGLPLEPGFRYTGLNTKWRVYRYREGQGFGPHFDEEDDDPLTGHTSRLTLLVYLSDVASGGETVFYKSKGREVLSVTPRRGLALVHAQGPKCLLHEGRPVGRGGDKWVLRSDVMVASL